VQNSAPSTLFEVLDSGIVRISALLRMRSISGTFDLRSGVNSGSINDFEFGNDQIGANRNHTSGTSTTLFTSMGYAPTSGTGGFIGFQYNGTINQTGGANGITRGLYVNPTLTAAADWRSIEWSNNTGWGLYGAGTANNYLAGNLGIGSTGLTGRNLRISAALTGSIGPVAVFTDGTISATSTTAAAYFYTNASTQAATFTLPILSHFSANQGVIGAGSAVTSQYGFIANSNLTGATNNYGFRGDIAAATGRWNIYMNGTAANYLAGDTAIGTTTTSGGRLTVRGSGTTSSTTALLVQNSTPSNLFEIKDNGEFLLGTQNVRLFTTSNGSTVGLAGRGLILATSSGSQGTGAFKIVGDSSVTTGNDYTLWLTTTFGPTSGTAITNGINLTQTINQTGGANGITRGLYVNPTLTSAADWRGIESVAASNANHTLLKLRNATVDVFTVKSDSKIGFFNATPVGQATTGIAESVFVENSGGTAVNVDSTFDGYTMQQVVKALRDIGILA
jgi:hypothetical protein